MYVVEVQYLWLPFNRLKGNDKYVLPFSLKMPRHHCNLDNKSHFIKKTLETTVSIPTKTTIPNILSNLYLDV